ncbi:Sm domain-containing protein [Mycena kentingensis (nom. inval.)]|nr:Sm domain-containing protein [Mycena kentingensis (nom. inval.)]
MRFCSRPSRVSSLFSPQLSALCTDQPLNVLLLNADEYRVDAVADDNSYGRYVGQILIPWKVVDKAEGYQRCIHALDDLDGCSLPCHGLSSFMTCANGFRFYVTNIRHSLPKSCRVFKVH